MIGFAFTAFLLVFTCVIGVPVAVLLVECLMALLPPRFAPAPDRPTPSMAVLVPAHNEATGLRPTLQGLLPQLAPHDRLIVIADNCTDETAEIARSTGATVIERHDLTRRGKGYALDYGVQFLASNPPEVVAIVDADCRVQPGTLQRIARRAVSTGRPAQALYVVERPLYPTPKDAVSALAFLVKNLVRPRGLDRLGLPCPLTGTGMAFPWAVICHAALASGNIVEDMQLGIDLALQGAAATYCPNTKVMAVLPQQEHAAKSQRTRWEHGHLQTLLTQVPRLMTAAFQQRRFDLLALALDLAIPPLSLLVMLWLAIAVVAVCSGALTGQWLPAQVAAIEGLAIGLAIVTAWFKFARFELPAKTLLAIPFYLLWKIPLYLTFVIKPQTKWVRTDRDMVET